MHDFILSCCSTADLSEAHFTSRNVRYICYHYMLDGKHYPDDLGKSMSFEAFYQAMTNGADTRTSQINAKEYKEYFESFLREGKDVLHVTLSSGISGSYNSARLAAEELRALYPERKLYVVDSLQASSGFGLLVDRLADLRDEGADIDTILQWVEKNKLHAHAWFFSTDLTFYVKGGRISKTSGFFGTMLKICPLLNINREGRLIPRQKLRGKSKAVREIVARMEEHVQDGLNYSGKCFISHSACLPEAQAVASLIEERFPALKGKVLINSIGTTIGSHTGPGTVALFFWGDERPIEENA